MHLYHGKGALALAFNDRGWLFKLWLDKLIFSLNATNNAYLCLLLFKMPFILLSP